MAVVYGEIDCLSKLTAMLKGIAGKDLKSFEELLEYKNECDKEVGEAERCANEELCLKIQSQKEDIAKHLATYAKPHDDGFFKRIFRTFVFKFKLLRMKVHLKKIQKKSEKFVRSRVEAIAGKFFKSKQVFDLNYSLILGASGEQQALDELRKLPDTFYVVNNVQLRFIRPLYEPRAKKRIYSIQADHVVVAPSGLFLIETKNWSRATASADYDFSAFDQIKRTNFALYCYLNPRISILFSFFIKTKKIKVRSILLMTGHKINRQERYVKVLALSQLRNYIEYFSPELSERERNTILKKLLKK